MEQPTISAENLSELKIVHGKPNAIFLFGGSNLMFGDIPRIELINTIFAYFDCDVYFFVDKKKEYYHNGLEGITVDVKTTAEYLRKLVSNYKKTLFTGIGMGGHAALLYGRKINIPVVVAFLPETKLEKSGKLNDKYIDLKSKFDNKSTSKTTFYLFTNKESTSSSEYIDCSPNVILQKYDTINIQEMYKNGELFRIFGKHVPLRK